MDGTHPAVGLLTGGPFEIRADWTRELGSGYSSVSIGEGTAVTMYADGDDEFLIALGAESGEELWRFPMGTTREGHSGAAAGPLGTPVIYDGVVIALSPAGRLVAVRLEDGSQLWSVDIQHEHGAIPMPHGFATTPLVVDDVAIVQTGAEAGSTLAVDMRSGEPRWSHGGDTVGYQSPILLELAGQQQLLTVGSHHIFGLDPATGDELWRHDHVAQVFDGHTQLVPVEGDRLLVHYINGALLYRVGDSSDGAPLTEIWRGLKLKSTLCPPVYHRGHFYGFLQENPVCLDAETGEVAWIAEEVEARGLILVDEHLVILATNGDLIVAAAAPDRFEEKIRIGTDVADSYTWPTFTDGRIFVRNLERMAALRVVPQPGG